MRKHGTLAKWNDERGFGFISPAQGSGDVFVHISAFPRDGQRPQVGEVLSFETESAPEGKIRATKVWRPDHRARAANRRSSRPSNGWPRVIRAIASVVVVAAVVAIGYPRIAGYFSQNQTSPLGLTPPAELARFKCDGRTMCSQMTSCAEAQFFLEHCPGTKMDGNNDGEPCEQQWCN